jgi:hypothetical protein
MSEHRKKTIYDSVASAAALERSITRAWEDYEDGSIDRTAWRYRSQVCEDDLAMLGERFSRPEPSVLRAITRPLREQALRSRPSRRVVRR